MPLDPERALSAALLARLRADPGLQPLIAGRAYDEPPADPVYPYLHLGRVQSRPTGGASGADEAEPLEHVVTLTAVSRFGGAEEAKAIAAAARACLHDADPPVADHALVSLRCTYADVFRAADWRSTYGVVRLRAVTEPLTPGAPA
jgi:hypothetical protein